MPLEFRHLLRASLTVTGRSQADLARALGIDRSSVARWCSGELRPSTERLSDLAAALDWDDEALARAIHLIGADSSRRHPPE